GDFALGRDVFQGMCNSICGCNPCAANPGGLIGSLDIVLPTLLTAFRAHRFAPIEERNGASITGPTRASPVRVVCLYLMSPLRIEAKLLGALAPGNQTPSDGLLRMMVATGRLLSPWTAIAQPEGWR